MANVSGRRYLHLVLYRSDALQTYQGLFHLYAIIGTPCCTILEILESCQVQLYSLYLIRKAACMDVVNRR
ncbi:hypothetical protein NDU88_007240 [Pleurodeles waltl]|uniref:Uncharacterized protein n=1 Tax=Pleurodeles waltl TaxID=8319 RepID=A0AAV7SRW8_PLEWA|nr:hypothetical protein NDU88_007240 [Pleurodeles waltl]